jgi:hypothetical protein
VAPALSALTKVLEGVFALIRRHYPELPHFVVVVATGAEGKKGVTHWGHFAARRWRMREEPAGAETPAGMYYAEVKISGEGLNRPPIEVLETMLHEVAHALAEARGIKDTSDSGKYHNAKFARLAAEVGLTPPESPVPKYGYAFTAPSLDLEARYGAALRELEAALTLYRLAPSAAAPKAQGADGGRVLVVCGCEQARKLRVSPSVLAQGPIICGVCAAPFACEGGEDEES